MWLGAKTNKEQALLCVPHLNPSLRDGRGEKRKQPATVQEKPLLKKNISKEAETLIFLTLQNT